MDKLEIHHYLAIAGAVLILVAFGAYLVQRPKGKIVTTGGGALGGLVLGTALGVWAMALFLNYRWEKPSPSAYMGAPWSTPEQGNLGYSSAEKQKAMQSLKDATMEEKAAAFEMKRPDAQPKPKAAKNK